MKTPKLKPIAVTVTPYYLQLKMYAIKTMAITRSSDRVLKWYVLKIVALNNDRGLASIAAMRLAAALEIPYLHNLYRGYPVTPGQLIELRKYPAVELDKI